MYENLNYQCLKIISCSKLKLTACLNILIANTFGSHSGRAITRCIRTIVTEFTTKIIFILGKINELVTVDRLVGVITGGVRGSKPLRIPMGQTGMFFHHIAQLRGNILPIFHKLFFSIHYSIADTGIFPKVLSPLFHQKMVVVKTTEGYELQMYYGKHLAGWKGQKDRGWTIRPPFQIFRNTAILPESVSDIPDME